MKRNRRLLTATLTLLLTGIVGLFPVSGMARQNNMPMMGGMGCMMEHRMPQGIEPARLPAPESEGARLLGQYCSQCHGIPGPGLHTPNEWPNVIARMDQRMQIMSRGRMMMRIEAPDDNELKILTAYLEKNGQRTIDVSKLEGAGTASGQAFQKSCSQCHALPDPAQHTRNEWPAVVERMRINMSAMGKPQPDQTTTDRILSFLQSHTTK